MSMQIPVCSAQKMIILQLRMASRPILTIYLVHLSMGLFQTAVMDVGQSGKRYGMAQCTRDISSIDYGKCLDAQLVTLRTIIGSKRGWEIYGSSCFMWYHDFQFYSNISITASEFCGCVSFFFFLAFLIRKTYLIFINHNIKIRNF